MDCFSAFLLFFFFFFFFFFLLPVHLHNRDFEPCAADRRKSLFLLVMELINGSIWGDVYYFHYLSPGSIGSFYFRPSTSIATDGAYFCFFTIRFGLSLSLSLSEIEPCVFPFTFQGFCMAEFVCRVSGL